MKTPRGAEIPPEEHARIVEAVEELRSWTAALDPQADTFEIRLAMLESIDRAFKVRHLIENVWHVAHARAIPFDRGKIVGFGPRPKPKQSAADALIAMGFTLDDFRAAAETLATEKKDD